MNKFAGIFLYDEKKRFLLQHRTDDAPTYPGEFGIFGGEIEEGESPEIAVKRECMEELEYELRNPKLILKTVLDTKYGQRAVYLFLEKYDTDKKLVLREGQNMKWVELKKVYNLKIVADVYDILVDMYNKI